jgi:exopolysaccharide biosynthesis predicted pyruvyltransferase EpsI
MTYISLIYSALHQCLDPRRPYVLWDFPHHPNVGDSAIWQGEIKALHQFFAGPPRHICELIQDSCILPTLHDSMQIVLHGGGNLGDLWEGHQLFRERVIRAYPNNAIVQMPQSIYFENQTNLDRCKLVFSGHKQLSIMTRDQASFDLAKKLHCGKTLLVPDMALALGEIARPCSPTVPILALLRTDHEKLVANDSEVLGAISAMDWLCEPNYIESRFLRILLRTERRLPALKPLLNMFRSILYDRISIKRIKRGCVTLSRGRVVITDRLHAHILCTLMRIPHVVIDNSYGKLSSFRTAWKTGGDSICFEASSLRDALLKAKQLL